MNEDWYKINSFPVDVISISVISHLQFCLHAWVVFFYLSSSVTAGKLSFTKEQFCMHAEILVKGC